VGFEKEARLNCDTRRGPSWGNITGIVLRYGKLLRMLVRRLSAYAIV
jgi:hypothetical protein